MGCRANFDMGRRANFDMGCRAALDTGSGRQSSEFSSILSV